MITLSTPLPETVDVELAPDLLLGRNADAPGTRATFGGPLVTPLTPAALAADSELAEFVAGSGYDFYKLVMTLSLAPSDGVEIRDSVVALNLTGELGQPIAWSMSPKRLESPPVTRSASGNVDITFGPFLKIGGETSQEKAVAEPFLVALGELESTPEWRLSSTSTVKLNDGYTLAMVVRVGRGHRVDGAVQVNARVAGARGIFRAKAQLPPSHATFTCPRSG